MGRIRISGIWKAALLAAVLGGLLLAACGPKPDVPDVQNLVATGMAGTQQARGLLDTIVAGVAATAEARQHSPTAAPPSAPPAPQPPPQPGAQPGAESGCPDNSLGRVSYASPADGYCFLYPQDFLVQKPSPGVVEFLGPALDKSPQPVRAYINIERKEPVNGRTLDEIAASLWSTSRSPRRVTNLTLGGQEALAADNLEIGETSWKIKQLLFTHNNAVFVLTISPFDGAAPYTKALPDVQRFWELMTASFVFR